MTRAPLQDLAQLTAAQKAFEEAQMRRLTEEEAEIRAELAALEQRHRAALALPVSDTVQHRQIGADILWQGWVGRSRHQLHIRLAQALAKKGAALRRLRRAHGRSSAAQELVQTARRETRDEKIRKEIAEDQRLMVLKAAARSES